MIWPLFQAFCTGVGTVVTLAFAAFLIVHLLRAAYWAVWVIPPQVRAHRSMVTVKRVVIVMWAHFRSELLANHYNQRRSSCYSHGYWPWEHKEYYA